MDAKHEKPAIKGKHIAITGILAFYRRQDAFDQIEACGGFSQNNVTYKQITLLSATIVAIPFTAKSPIRPGWPKNTTARGRR